MNVAKSGIVDTEVENKSYTEAKELFEIAIKSKMFPDVDKALIAVNALTTSTEERKKIKKDWQEELKAIPYREKINSLTELHDRGLCIIEEDELAISNRILDVLIKKGLRVSHLAEMTGISRQNINAVVKNKMKPGIDFALKVSFVLDTPINELFSLTDSAWVKPYKQNMDSTLYVDLADMEVIDNSIKKKKVAKSEYEYYHKETREFLTKKQKDELMRKYVDSNLSQKIEKLSDDDSEKEMSLNQINSQAIEECKSEFNENYVRIYNKLGLMFQPYQV